MGRTGNILSQLPVLPDFLSNQASNAILWCYTGGGHLFAENLKEMKKISSTHPIILLFSNAGALVANRYGFFWNLVHSEVKKENFYIIIEEAVAKFNIQDLLERNDFSFSIVLHDPAFSMATALANSNVKCIIASPLTANTAAKLAFGIADSFISNLLSSGLKSEKQVGILPTDFLSRPIKSTLPIRQIQSVSIHKVSPNVCKFNALSKTTKGQLKFIPQYCVGCQQCVKKYSSIFSYGDEVNMKIREVDVHNIQKLRSEVTVFQNPREIDPFLRRCFEKKK